MKISGCVAFVTGGASGIGRGICEVLLQRGAKVKNLTLSSYIGLAQVHLKGKYISKFEVTQLSRPHIYIDYSVKTKILN